MPIEPCQKTLQKYKSRLINILKSLREDGNLGYNTYQRPYPTRAGPPSSIGYLIFTKDTPIDL